MHSMCVFVHQLFELRPPSSKAHPCNIGTKIANFKGQEASISYGQISEASEVRYVVKEQPSSYMTKLLH